MDLTEDLVGGRYRIDESTKVRQGGQASVYRAVDTKSGEVVALKFIEGLFADPLAMRIFKREVISLQSLNHPGIIRYRDSGDDDGRPFIVLDWVEDRFDHFLEEHGPLEARVAFNRYFVPVSRAIAYMHMRQVEHRDIKPSNILLDKTGSPIVSDLGVGKALGVTEVTDHTIRSFRSGIWAPPEIDSPPYTRDVYSLGVLLVRSVSTQPITEFHQLQGAIEQLQVPSEFRDLLTRMVSVDPRRRPENAAVVIDEIDAFARSQKKASAKSQAIGVKLTRSAREKIGGAFATPDQVRRIINADLSGDVFVSWYWEKDKKRHDQERLLLIGEAITYVLSRGTEDFDFVMIDAFQVDDEALNRSRERAMPINGAFHWVFTPAGPPGRDNLLRRLGLFHDSQPQDKSDAPEVETKPTVLDRWRKVLAAREQLERGERQPMHYSRVETINGNGVFSVGHSEAIEGLGTEWVVKSREGARSLGQGEVVATSEDMITLRWIRPPHGLLPTRGLLEPHLGKSQSALQRQRDALTTIDNGTAVSQGLRELVLNPRSARPPQRIDEPSWQLELDDDKRSAIQGALGGAECVVLKGPPGTGKTRFITELVLQELRRDPHSKVLIVSQTHNAVDNALERIAASGTEGVVRLGNPDDSKISAAVRPLLLRSQLSDWAKQVRQKSIAHLDALIQENGIDPRQFRSLLVLKELEQRLKQQEMLERRLEDDRDDYTTLLTELDLNGDGVPIADRVSANRRAISALRSEAANLLDKAELGELLSGKQEVSAHDVGAVIELISEQSHASEDLLERLGLQSEWLDRVETDKTIESEYLRSVSVVGGTCVGFIGHPAVRDIEFDLCVIDEASRATSTEALVPAVRARRLVLVGDLNQLPPMDEDLLSNEMVLEDHQLSREDVTETLFKRLAEYLPEPNQYELREQRRMIAPIGDMISACFYDGRLKSPNVEGLGGYELLGKPVLWIDTSRAKNRHEDSGADSPGQIVNRLEADLVVRRLREMQGARTKGLLSPPAGKESLEVLVIAPYRSQVDHLRRRISREALPSLSVTIDTVDAVQGRETDIAFLSVTRSNLQGRMGFLGPNYWRRINVALSRARFGLTIVGDAEFSGRSALAPVIAYIRENLSTCELRQADA